MSHVTIHSTCFTGRTEPDWLSRKNGCKECVDCTQNKLMNMLNTLSDAINCAALQYILSVRCPTYKDASLFTSHLCETLTTVIFVSTVSAVQPPQLHQRRPSKSRRGDGTQSVRVPRTTGRASATQCEFLTLHS